MEETKIAFSKANKINKKIWKIKKNKKGDKRHFYKDKNMNKLNYFWKINVFVGILILVFILSANIVNASSESGRFIEQCLEKSSDGKSTIYKESGRSVLEYLLLRKKNITEKDCEMAFDMYKILGCRADHPSYISTSRMYAFAKRCSKKLVEKGYDEKNCKFNMLVFNQGSVVDRRDCKIGFAIAKNNISICGENDTLCQRLVLFSPINFINWMKFLNFRLFLFIIGILFFINSSKLLREGKQIKKLSSKIIILNLELFILVNGLYYFWLHPTGQATLIFTLISLFSLNLILIPIFIKINISIYKKYKNRRKNTLFGIFGAFFLSLIIFSVSILTSKFDVFAVTAGELEILPYCFVAIIAILYSIFNVVIFLKLWKKIFCL